MPTVVCFGELLVDMVSDTPDASLQEAPRFLKAPGGAPANVAAGLARLGVSSRFIGQVGDDPFGEWLRRILAGEQIDVTHLLTSPTARTTMAFIATRSDGRKDICFYRNPGADAQLEPAELHPKMLANARLFHCGSVALSQSPTREAQFEAVRMAVERGVAVSYDPNWRPSLWADKNAARKVIWDMMALCDIVKLADEEWEFITETTDWKAGAARIRAVGPRLVVVTSGEHGAFYDCAQAAGLVEGFKVAALDTLGAGDSFMAGLLAQVLSYDNLEEALNDRVLPEMVRFANACGALATQQAGAIPALPKSSEVAAFLARSGVAGKS